jgi:hypothetical protein
MEIFKALIGVMREISPIVANRKHPQGWQYRSVDDIYDNLQPLLAKHGVITVPIVQSVERSVITTPKGGQLFHVLVKVEYRFYAEDGSHVSCVVAGEGVDTLDNALAKATTDAHGKALVQMFVIPKTKNGEELVKPQPSLNKNRERLIEVIKELNVSNSFCKETIESLYSGKTAAELADYQVNSVVREMLIQWAVSQGYKNGDINQVSRSFSKWLEQEHFSIGREKDSLIAAAWGAFVNAWLVTRAEETTAA